MTSLTGYVISTENSKHNEIVGFINPKSIDILAIRSTGLPSFNVLNDIIDAITHPMLITLRINKYFFVLSMIYPMMNEEMIPKMVAIAPSKPIYIFEYLYGDIIVLDRLHMLRLIPYSKLNETNRRR